MIEILKYDSLYFGDQQRRRSSSVDPPKANEYLHYRLNKPKNNYSFMQPHYIELQSYPSKVNFS